MEIREGLKNRTCRQSFECISSARSTGNETFVGFRFPFKVWRLISLVALALSVAFSGCGGNAEFDKYGGYPGISMEATGRFRVEKNSGRWWLVTPVGNAFFSHGIQVVRSFGTREADGGSPYEDNILAKYGTKEAWAENALKLFRSAGLNTIGDFSEHEYFAGELPYVMGLFFGRKAPEIEGGPGAYRGGARDFFDPEFEQGVLEEAERASPCAEDPFCIGVFLDDEVPWTTGLFLAVPLFDAYLYLAPGAPGKAALQTYLEEKYEGDISEFNTTWSTAFTSFDDIQDIDPTIAPLGDEDPSDDTAEQNADRFAFRAVVAERFYSITSAALDDISPNMLNLGARFLPGDFTTEVLQVVARHIDVLSYNAFEVADAMISILNLFSWTGALMPDPLFADVEIIQETVDLPILLSSFTYRAEVEGLNDWPPAYIFEILDTQADRADRYEVYMNKAMELPSAVGAHWFEHADQPAAGRFDGENSNFGIVNIEDEPYTVLVDRMSQVSNTFFTTQGLLKP